MISREKLPEETIVFDPPGLDRALIGWASVDGQGECAVYSYRSLLEYFTEELGGAESAQEWIEVNVLGVHFSKNTPVIVFDGDDGARL